MAVYKDKKTNNWRAVIRYTNYKGERKQTQKRGFKTKKEAQEWERAAMLKQTSSLDMTFQDFFALYAEYARARVKESTWETKFDPHTNELILSMPSITTVCRITRFSERERSES